MAEFSRHYFLGPVLLLGFLSFGSIFFRSSSPQHSNPPLLKGSVTKVDRLQSWMREHAIDALPWSTTNNTEDYYEEVNATLNAMRMWAGQNNNTKARNVIVDVISIGSFSRIDYLQNQRDTWASPAFVRNMFMATEMNTDRSIIFGNASCQALEQTCNSLGSEVELRSRLLEANHMTNETMVSDIVKLDADTKNSDGEEMCLQRRLGLAMGTSIRRYRKISNAFKLQLDTLRNDINILPNFLISAYDQVSYNTTALERCEEENARVYSPSTSLKHLSDTSFSFPTNQAVIVFNRMAIQRWMLQVSCSSIVPSNNTETFESNFCSWMKNIIHQPSNQSLNTFDAALSRALEIFNENSVRGFNDQYEAISVSDLLYKYSYSMHLLCDKQDGVVPSGNEMTGYLIHRFNISARSIHQSECLNDGQHNLSA